MNTAGSESRTASGPTLMRYCRLLSSVANHRSNSPSVRGYSESTTSVRYPWESLEARGYVESRKPRADHHARRVARGAADQDREHARQADEEYGADRVPAPQYPRLRLR